MARCESKASSERHHDEIVAIDILSCVIEFAHSLRFTEAITDFQKDNCRYFSEAQSDEYSLEQTAVFNQYQNLLDDLFGGYSSQIGVTLMDVYKNCRDAGYCCILSLHWVIYFGSLNS